MNNSGCLAIAVDRSGSPRSIRWTDERDRPRPDLRPALNRLATRPYFCLFVFIYFIFFVFSINFFLYLWRTLELTRAPFPSLGPFSSSSFVFFIFSVFVCVCFFFCFFPETYDVAR